MTTQTKALKLALEALEVVNRIDLRQVNEAITAIKEALAQPEQEPVDLVAACEYADQRWSGAEVPIEWLRHFVHALKQ